MRTWIILAITLTCCSCASRHGTGRQHTSSRFMEWNEALLTRSAERDPLEQTWPRPIFNVFPLEWNEDFFLSSARDPVRPYRGRDPDCLLDSETPTSRDFFRMAQKSSR